MAARPAGELSFSAHQQWRRRHADPVRSDERFDEPPHRSSRLPGVVLIVADMLQVLAHGSGHVAGRRSLRGDGGRQRAVLRVLELRRQHRTPACRESPISAVVFIPTTAAL
jgi:hypothetical protein